jgi:hypothetical protein
LDGSGEPHPLEAMRQGHAIPGRRNDPVTAAAAAGPAAGHNGGPGALDVATRWARRWPYVSTSVIGVAVLFATSAVLAAVIPAASPVTWWVGYLVGVVIGTSLAGLKGARGWVVAPVITLAIGLVLGGTLAVLGVHLP